MRGVFKRRGRDARSPDDAFGKDLEAVEPLYLARVTIRNEGKLHRRAELAPGGSVDMGVHGPIKDHYRLTPERDLPLPVDYIVAATGG